MTLEEELTLLDPFTHTEQDRFDLMRFDFLKETHKAKNEKVKIIETFCTLVTVTGKYLEKEAFKEVLKKIDEIREIIRLNNHYIHISTGSIRCTTPIFAGYLIQLDQSKFDF